MTEVKSKKPLLEAIQNGEQNIKVTDPKFLLACLVAEECDNDKSNVKKFLNVILGSKNVVDMQDRPKIRIGIVNEKGKVWRMFINLSICSTALGFLVHLKLIKALLINMFKSVSMFCSFCKEIGNINLQFPVWTTFRRRKMQHHK